MSTIHDQSGSTSIPPLAPPIPSRPIANPSESGPPVVAPNSIGKTLPPTPATDSSTVGQSRTVSDTPATAVPAQDAEHPATLASDDTHALPLANKDVHPSTQAAHLDSAPEPLVRAQVEKVKQSKREELGLPEKGHFVPGIADDKLWALRRRFDTQVLHVLSPPTKLPKGEPDLRPTTLPSVPFNSDLLRSNGERVFATAGIWSIYFVREMGRLMSWDKENRVRTAAWCTGYFVAWWFSLVLPVLFGILILLTVSTPSRKILFPPVPPSPGQPHSATDPTGKRGDESAITALGHPVEHRSKSEQIEQQAWEMTNLVQRFGARVVVGGQGKGKRGNAEVGRKQGAASSSSSDDEDDEEDEDTTSGKVEIPTTGGKEGDVVVAAEGEHAEKGKVLAAKQKRKQAAQDAKKKRDEMVGKMTKATQDGLGDFADALERFANALSPPRPYPKNAARYKFAGAILLPVMLGFAVIPAHFWAQGFSFAFGVGFFGQPLLKRAAKKFVKLVPDWQEKLDLRNSIFSKVPTNAQLTLHILRVAEASYKPLPPPPAPPTPEHVKKEVEHTSDFDAGHELPDKSAKHVDSDTGETDPAGEGGPDDKEGGVKHAVVKTGKKGFLGGMRLMAKKAATFRADVTVDGKAKVARGFDKVVFQSRVRDEEKPDSYPAKFDGTSGQLVIRYGPSTPATLLFIPAKGLSLKPTLEKPIDDLVEMRKRGVFIARSLLGWVAGTSLEGAGLEMRFKDHHLRASDTIGKTDLEDTNPHDEMHEGDTITFSHVARRDQLFARLMSIPQKTQWETL